MFPRCLHEHATGALTGCSRRATRIQWYAPAELSARAQRPGSRHALVPVAEGVWVVHQPLRFFGIEIGTRMTVIRLEDGMVWLHSPVALDEDLALRIERIGPVRFIVAPNKLHHLYAGDAHRRFPDASLHLAPGLLAKRPDLAGGLELEPDTPPPWGPEIVAHHVGGLRVLREVVFFHPPTRTLVLSDLAFNIGRDAPWTTRQFGRLAGAYDKLGCPTDFRLLFIADREAFATSIATIRQWNFERIILAHGHVVTEHATHAFEAAFAFAKPPTP